MTITLMSSGENAATLTEKTNSCSAVFPIPCSKLTLIALVRSLLADPERNDAEAGPVSVSRYRDGIKVAVGSGTFAIRYFDAYPLILEA
ncbi:MAG: hypothetical protein ACOH2H_11010 [Cypionkella sp.]